MTRRRSKGAGTAKPSAKPQLRRRVRHAALTPFGLAALACFVLAGWALWNAGIFDGPIAAKVRTSSVYAAPGTGVDVPAAERIIGNRRLVVVVLEPNSDLSAACDRIHGAAAGTLALVMSRGDGKWDTYGCSQLPGASDTHLGDAYVAETTIGQGLDGFVDRPLDAMKLIALNYDELAETDIVPAESRAISPSLPRYLIAGAAILAVLVGSALLFAAAKRTGSLAARRREARDSATDGRTVLSAATATVAQQIMDLDGRFAPLAAKSVPAKKGRSRRGSASQYAELASDYTNLMVDIVEADRRGEIDFSAYVTRAEALSAGLRGLTA